jgi:peptide-methionine (S)-S-oxide reductase
MGTTGHAEVIQITFQPSIITYDQLLEIFWNIHDPTTLNQQGADIGTQYRSVIFTTTSSQAEAAKRSKIEAQTHFPVPIVTSIVPLENFYSAESYHHQYYSLHSDQPYCDIVISPKIQKLLQKYSHLVK